jgi:hypothetical protein
VKRLVLSGALLLACSSALAQAPAAPPAPSGEPPAAAEGATSAETSAPAEAGPSSDPGGSQGAAPEPAAELSAAELEALGFTTAEGGAEPSGLDTDLHLSGFIDFSIAKLIAPKKSLFRGILPNRTNFYVGNINLYLTKNLTKTFRTMAEVRFLYKPNGDIPLADGTATPTTSTKDHADYDRALRWGGVEIERVYLEWAPHSLLAVRAGQFLTPYGIWNVDHGSPTFIPVVRPYVIGENLFPERQTGFEIFGRWDATQNGTLGYHVTLSNGEGPISEYRDLDENKAIGGRLFWEQHNVGYLRIGGSAYYGRSTDASTTVGITEGVIKPIDKVYRQFDALSLALDAVWRYRDLLMQAEWISRQRTYTGSGRVALENEYVQQTVFPIDVFCWGVYGLIGYRLPWFGIMPYFVGQYLDNTGHGGVHTQVTNLQFGLNIRPVDMIVLKLEFSHAFFARELLGSNDPIRFIQAQVAWAF